MGKIRNKIIISSILFICISCIDREERIVREVCSEFAATESTVKKELSIIPYIMATEQISDSNCVVYTIEFKVNQKSDKPIRYTTYFKSHSIHIFIKQNNKPLKSISKEVQEEIYNWGERSIKYETPSYILVINLTTNKYKVMDDESIDPSVDSLLNRMYCSPLNSRHSEDLQKACDSIIRVSQIDKRAK